MASHGVLPNVATPQWLSIHLLQNPQGPAPRQDLRTAADGRIAAAIAQGLPSRTRQGQQGQSQRPVTRAGTGADGGATAGVSYPGQKLSEM